MANNIAFSRFVIVLLAVVASGNVWSLETLGVVGPVVDAKPYYSRLIRSSLPDRNMTLSATDAGRILKWSGFQRYDSGLQATNFTPQAFTQSQADKLVTPICLIANDAASVSWLKRTKIVLIREKAICYLVKTASEGDIAKLRELAKGITFIALNPVFIIEKFAVPGYPALISRSGVEQ